MRARIHPSVFCGVLGLVLLASGHAGLGQAQQGSRQNRGAPTDGSSVTVQSIPEDVGALDPKQAVRQLISSLRSGDLKPIEPWFEPSLYVRMLGNLDQLQAVATNLTDPQRISIRRSNRDEMESVYEVEIEHRFPRLPDNAQIVGINARSYWLIGYNAAINLIDTFSFRESTPLEQAGLTEYQVDDPAQPSMRHALQILAAPDFSNQNSIKFLFATTRKYAAGSFTYDRADLTFGGVDVHVPDDHRMGHVELPGTTGWTPFRYEEKLDLVKHFAISKLGSITPADWKDIIRSSGQDEALIFVHGFNNTFDDSVYRAAQILWDLRYKGIPILFSWPSWGGAADPASIARSYAHDRDSALTESDTFDGLLQTLFGLGIKKVHLLVHSMGNFLVLNALRRETGAKTPIKIGEWILAAPDIDTDQFSQFVPTIQPFVGHMTLYASAQDNALLASMAARGNKPRAGFVPNGKPIILAGVDSIDISALGGELFGLNHDVFASNRSLIDDIGLVLDGRPPGQRLRQIRPVPENPPPPQYWRFVP